MRYGPGMVDGGRGRRRLGLRFLEGVFEVTGVEDPRVPGLYSHDPLVTTSGAVSTMESTTFEDPVVSLRTDFF